MYCQNCGAQLPDDANFCMKCGVPLKPSAANKEQKWQTCTIEYYEGLLSSKYIARAVGPSGLFVAMEVALPIIGSPTKTLEDLISRLVADGWDPAGKGEASYSYKFRKPV